MLPKPKQSEYEQKIIKILKEYDANPGTTEGDGLVAIIAEMQVKIEELEKQVRRLRMGAAVCG